MRLWIATLQLFVTCNSYTFSQISAWKTVDSIKNFYLSIDCADPDNCMSAGLFGNSVTYIRGTRDGGKTWKTIYRDSVDFSPFYLPPILKRVAYNSPDNAIVTGDSGTVLRTVDGGEHWTATRVQDSAVKLSALAMYNAQYGVTGGLPRNVYRTMDSGVTWNRLTLPDQVDNLLITDVAMPAPEIVIVTMASAPELWATLYSSDSGNTSDVRAGAPHTLRVAFTDEHNGWAVGVERDYTTQSLAGNDVIMHTTDGAKSWEYQLNEKVTPIFGLFEVDFIDSLNRVAGGGQGKIYKRTNGGKKWAIQVTDLDTLKESSVLGISLPQPHCAYAAISSGKIIQLKEGVSGIKEYPAKHVNRKFYIGPNVVKSGDGIQLYLIEEAALPKEAEVMITNSKGDLVHAEGNVVGMGLPITITTGRLAAGCYFATILLDGEIIDSIPFIVY